MPTLSTNYCCSVTAEVARDLRRTMEDLGVRVPILSSATGREATAHIYLKGLDPGAFMRRLFSAELSFDSDGERFYCQLRQQFDIWFQPEPADPDGMVVTFRPKSY